MAQAPEPAGGLRRVPEYAERFLAPEQIDAVDVAAYVGGR